MKRKFREAGLASGRQPIDSKDLSIDLTSQEEGELFKWFLACLLFGKPIQQEVAKRAYGEFVKEGLVTPDAIINAGWEKLVEVLDRGHYVRYDYSTATKLLDVCTQLKKQYGSMRALLKHSGGVGELSERLKAFKGVGPKTAEIFINELLKSGWQLAL